MYNDSINIGKEIREELMLQERSVVWLAKKLGCERTSVYRIFNARSIDTDLLLHLSVILKKDFFQLYSSFLKNIE